MANRRIQNVQTKTVRTNADAGQRQQRIARCDHLQAAGVLALVAQRAHQHYARATESHQTHGATENEPPPSAKRLRGVLRTSASTTISGRLLLVPRRCVVERRDRGNYLITLAPSAPPASCVEFLAVLTFIADRTMRIEMHHGHDPPNPEEPPSSHYNE